MSGCSSGSVRCMRRTTAPTATAAPGRPPTRAGEHAPRRQVHKLMRTNGIQDAKRRGKPWRTRTRTLRRAGTRTWSTAISRRLRRTSYGSRTSRIWRYWEGRTEFRCRSFREAILKRPTRFLPKIPIRAWAAQSPGAQRALGRVLPRPDCTTKILRDPCRSRAGIQASISSSFAALATRCLHRGIMASLDLRPDATISCVRLIARAPHSLQCWLTTIYYSVFKLLRFPCSMRDALGFLACLLR
jgi:hypothetical protein